MGENSWLPGIQFLTWLVFVLLLGAASLPAEAEWTITVTPPRLGLRHNRGKSELHWPADIDGCKLQRSDSLAPGNQWRDVPNVPTDPDGEAHLSLDDSAPRAFFRLSKP
jgi:hypothetical protein